MLAYLRPSCQIKMCELQCCLIHSCSEFNICQLTQCLEMKSIFKGMENIRPLLPLEQKKKILLVVMQQNQSQLFDNRFVSTPLENRALGYS